MEILFLAVALAMDSVALSIASGAKCRVLRLGGAVRVAFAFGFFQAMMPLFGWLLGLTFVKFIAAIDHFIAFGILVFLGVKMILEAREVRDEACLSELGLRFLLAGALATSIDALAVGVTLSFEQVDIVFACGVIGAVCFGLCIAACYVGKFLGQRLESRALVLGGAILVVIGFKILLTHLADHGF